MKLRNKKTGEIIDVYKGQMLIHFDNGRKTKHIKSLDELKDWEEVKEPKEYWVVDYITCGVDELTIDPKEPEMDDFNKQIGNYFETKEEAEKAVEKLKAWKRLKELGFRFIGETCEYKSDKHFGSVFYETSGDVSDIYEDASEFYDDLDLLFGGEE